MDILTAPILVHPVHGPVSVGGTRSRWVRDTEVRYVDLFALDQTLRLSAPIDRLEEIGIRPLFSPTEIDRLIGILRDVGEPEERTWARRFKHNWARLATGDPTIIAAVVRDLHRRQTSRGLSIAEREQLQGAMRPLVLELSIVLQQPQEDVVAMIEDAAADPGEV